MSAIRWRCAGCGFEAPDALAAEAGAGSAEARLVPAFACPRRASGDGADHVLGRLLDPALAGWSAPSDEPNPFLRYRSRLSSHQAAMTAGIGDEGFLAIAGRLDAAIARVDGRGFVTTPFAPRAALAEACGLPAGAELWVKDETGNVSGSHKARHLAGVMLHLLVSGEGGGPVAGPPVGPAGPPLAIASCGNAALAAAVVARAVAWPLEVFVPPDADAAVRSRLADLGATINVCPRRPGERGDPCYLRFREATGRNALPFCCQGPDNGLTIEGGETLAWEMIEAQGAPSFDRIVVQVGGGALASSMAAGMREARALGRLDRLPRLHATQTRGAHPVERAYRLVLARVEKGAGIVPPDGAGLGERAGEVERRASPSAIREALGHARAHRGEFMWPWESEPRSVAHGILDDETYDWAAVVEGMLLTGGWPIVVDEETLVEANRLGRSATGIDVDHTGTAGLAGLLALAREGAIGPGERTAVLFTGRRRSRDLG